MIYYKITDCDSRSFGGVQWGPMIRHEGGPFWVFDSKEIAAVFEPMFSDLEIGLYRKSCLLWECVAENVERINSFEFRAEAVTTIKPIQFPVLRNSQRVLFFYKLYEELKDGR